MALKTHHILQLGKNTAGASPLHHLLPCEKSDSSARHLRYPVSGKRLQKTTEIYGLSMDNLWIWLISGKRLLHNYGKIHHAINC